MIAFIAGAMIWAGLILVFGGPVYFVIAGVCILLLAFALLAKAVDRADRRLQRELEQTPIGHQRLGLHPTAVRARTRHLHLAEVDRPDLERRRR